MMHQIIARTLGGLPRSEAHRFHSITEFAIDNHQRKDNCGGGLPSLFARAHCEHTVAGRVQHVLKPYANQVVILDKRMLNPDPVGCSVPAAPESIIDPSHFG